MLFVRLNGTLPQLSCKRKETAHGRADAKAKVFRVYICSRESHHDDDLSEIVITSCPARTTFWGAVRT